jgi:hypothetical protein
VSDVVGQDDDFEFLPSDDIDEVETPAAEDDAVHVQRPDEARELLTVEAEDFDADGLDEDEADELGTADGERASADAGAASGAPAPEGADEHESDLQEVIRRQYGLMGDQPDDDLRPDDGLRQPGTGEFVCRSCFLRRPASQLADADGHTCVDCAAGDAAARG